MLWTYVINDLNGEKIVGTSAENKLEKKFNQNLGLKKLSRKNPKANI